MVTGTNGTWLSIIRRCNKAGLRDGLCRRHLGGSEARWKRAIRQSYRRPLACPKAWNSRTGKISKRLN